MERNNDIMVSVCCLAYNHAKYIRNTLEGFVSQKTNFKFEVLVHDDASTDGTADIIREYEAKYPDIIKPIYQTENQYSKKIRISITYQYPRAKGKYIAFCEGDDYWCSDTKLQEQFDIMENNPNVSFCAHKVRAIAESGEDLEKTYPEEKLDLKEGLIKAEDFAKVLLTDYPFQTSGHFIRGEVIRKMLEEKPEFVTKMPIGDQPLRLYCSLNGDAYYLDKEYSKYRHNVPGSWSKRKDTKEYMATGFDRLADGYEAFDKYSNGKYHKLVYKNVYNLRMRRINKTGKIYSVKEAFQFIGYIPRHLFRAVKKQLSRGKSA